MNCLKCTSDLARNQLNVLQSSETAKTTSTSETVKLLLINWSSVKLDAAIGEHKTHAKKPQWHYQLWEGRVKAKTLRIVLNKNKLKPNCCSDACGVTLWIEKCACDAKKKNSNGTRTKRMKANALQHTLNKKQLKPDRCCNTLDSKLFLQNDCILLWIMNTHTSNQIY